MRRIYYRTIRNNQIKLLGRKLSTPELTNNELDGIRCCFMPYPGEEKEGLTALWGTEKLSIALRKVELAGLTEIGNLPEWEEDNRTLAPDGFKRWYFWRVVNSRN